MQRVQESYSRYKKLDEEGRVFEIGILDATDDQLRQISAEQGIGLSLFEMKEVRRYFAKKKRNPTDVELQSIGQAWSEHCCYKSSKPVIKKYLIGIDSPDVLAREDAGVMSFDEDHAYALRIESHNHPSAIEPYGGAATGIGGIVRDVLCMGARPVALVDPLYFGPLDTPSKKLPKGTKHPKYIFSGVVSGIRDYGNRIGVPTISGSVYFDDGYTGNPIINVGCVGFMKKSRLSHSSARSVGDLLVLVGGKTGRDGIHGVTFASAVLGEHSEEGSRGAVQLGDPITKEPLIHACLDANRKGLVEGMKDLGGGGLSCVVGEMVHACSLGAEVDLAKVPLKEQGLRPWEIWVSESQERMMLAVRKENLEEVLKIFGLWDVDATVVGRVIKPRVVRLFYGRTKVFELDSEFLTSGPEYCRPCEIPRANKQEPWEARMPEPKDYGEALLKMLSSPNICSRSWIIRQYDHEVQGKVAIKPLQGKLFHSSHGDASVIKPLRHSNKGLAIAAAGNPLHARSSPYWGGMGTIDELCRNLVSVGARPHSFTNCLNFGNPEFPSRMGELTEVVRGMGEAARFLGIPTPSGNVSLYNESAIGSVPPTASVLGAGIVEDVRKCVTTDLKRDGDSLFVVGETYDELGGSEYLRISGLPGEGLAPRVDLSSLKRSITQLLGAMSAGLVRSCHDVSQGGLGVCLAEMCFGANAGADVDLSSVGRGLRDDAKLFSESNTRWIVEVRKEDEKAFARTVANARRLGMVAGKNIVVRDGKRKLVDLSIERAREHWEGHLWKTMG